MADHSKKCFNISFNKSIPPERLSRCLYFTTFEAFCQHIELAAPPLRRRGLARTNRDEATGEIHTENVRRGTGKGLNQGITALFQDPFDKNKRGSVQFQECLFIHDSLPGNAGGGIAQELVCPHRRQRAQSLTGNLRQRKITSDQLATGQRRHCGNIDGNDPSRRADAINGILRPAAGGSAEFDYGVSRPQQPFALIDFNQLIDGPRTKSLSLRAPDIGIALMRPNPRSAVPAQETLTPITSYSRVPAGA